MSRPLQRPPRRTLLWAPKAHPHGVVGKNKSPNLRAFSARSTPRVRQRARGPSTMDPRRRTA
eukprot:2762563-Pyramimonas_sp.AAC.1